MPVRTPAVSNGLFVFAGLDDLDDSVKVLTVGWRFKDLPCDPWSSRFMAFKTNDPDAVRRACAVVPPYLKPTLAGLGRAVTVVCALGHADTSISAAGPVAKLGKAIAATMGWNFQPGLLTHKPHAKLATAGALSKRIDIAKNSYTSKRPPDPTVLVVDDLVTSGTTIREIAQAVTSARSGTKVRAFAIAKNESHKFAAEHGVALNNDHIAPAILKKWDAA